MRSIDKPANIDDFDKGIVYIESKVDKIRLSNNCIIIEGKDIKYVPICQVGTLVIRGDTSITTSLLSELIENGVSISLLGYYGNYKCTVHSDICGNVEVRHNQLRKSDSIEGFSIGRNVIIAKMKNQLAVVDRHIRNYGHSELIDKTIDNINKYIEFATISMSKTQLIGYEGKAAEQYFGIFNQLIRKQGFNFNGRSHNPPLDNVNAMLSFGYGLLRVETERNIRLCGLDPFVWFIHSERSGKKSLALDLMEEYRPYMVDRMILSLVNMGMVDPKSFIIESDAVMCDSETRIKIIDEFQKRKNEYIKFKGKSITYGELMFRQMQLLVRAIKGKERYKTYIWR